MSFRTYGRPGPPEKFTIPPGFGLWEYTRNGAWDTISSPVYIVAGDDVGGAGSGSVVIGLDDTINAADLDPGDLKVLAKQTRYKEASRAWTAAGSNPRIRAGVNYLSMNGNNDFNGVTLENTDPMIASASCQEADLEIGSAEMPFIRNYKNTDNITSGILPRLRLFNYFEDAPGSRALCVSIGRIEVQILVKLSLVSFTTTQNIGGTLTRLG